MIGTKGQGRGHSGRVPLLAGALITLIGAGALTWWVGARSTDPGMIVSPSVAHGHAIGSGVDAAIYLGHHDGVLVSVDAGRSWAVRLQGQDVMAMVPGTDGRLALAGHGFLADVTPTGELVQLGSDLPTLDIHAMTASSNLRERWISAADGRVFRSADAGVTWRNASTGPIALIAGGSGRLVGLDPFGGLVISLDGESWLPWAEPPTAPILALAAAPSGEAVAIGSSQGTFVTLDHAITWSQLSSAPSTAVTVSPDGREVIVLRKDGVIERHALPVTGAAS